MQILLWLLLFNFFDQQHSVMTLDPLFGFKPTVVYFPSSSATGILVFPRTSALGCAAHPLLERKATLGSSVHAGWTFELQWRRNKEWCWEQWILVCSGGGKKNKKW
jgi:hypothetical protein